MNGIAPARRGKELAISAAVVLAVLLCAVAGLWWWFRVVPDQALDLREPYQDGTSPEMAAAVDVKEATSIEGTFVAFNGESSDWPGEWPMFRGPHRDNVASSGGLAESWPEEGPPVVWAIDVGEGYAGPAVRNGRVYLLDYDEEAGGDAMRCFSLESGEEIWRRWYEVRIKRNHGMSRTVPAVSEDAVVSVGPKCHVMCVDADTGDFRWGIDLVTEFGTRVPLWYTGQCPLIEDGIAVIAPAGDEVLMMGVECATGRVVWRTPNPNGWAMSHSSVMPMTLDGRRTFVYCAVGGMVGVAADGPEAGTVLWETDEWDLAVVAPSPVPVGDDRIFVTAGYGAGSMLFQVSADGIRHLNTIEKTEFASEQQTPVFRDGYLYGVLPADGGAANRQLVCYRLDGGQVWSSGKDRRFGLGPFLIVDDRIFALTDDGELFLAAASPSGYRELARSQVLQGREAWAPMALAGNRLLVRDSKRMVCLEIGSEID